MGERGPEPDYNALVNKIFGLWKVIGYDKEGSANQRNGAYYICVCQGPCKGRVKSVRGSDLKAGRAVTCGDENCREKWKVKKEGNKRREASEKRGNRKKKNNP